MLVLIARVLVPLYVAAVVVALPYLVTSDAPLARRIRHFGLPGIARVSASDMLGHA